MRGGCDRCSSRRIADLSTKCSDRCYVGIDNIGREQGGYSPSDMGITDRGNDYVSFGWCLDCGKIQGAFPLPPCKLEQG